MTCERITTDPDVMAGLPCITGLRFPVATAVAMVADGMTTDEILAEHPDLTTEDIHESLLYPAEAVRERELPLRHTARNSSSRNNLSPLLAEGLKAAGHDAVHLRDLGMQAAPDPAVLQRAQVDERVLVPADTGFGGLLSRSRATGPSVLLIRPLAGRCAAEQSAIILANLDQIADDPGSRSCRGHRRRPDPDTPPPNAWLIRFTPQLAAIAE